MFIQVNKNTGEPLTGIINNNSNYRVTRGSTKGSVIASLTEADASELWFHGIVPFIEVGRTPNGGVPPLTVPVTTDGFDRINKIFTRTFSYNDIELEEAKRIAYDRVSQRRDAILENGFNYTGPIVDHMVPMEVEDRQIRARRLNVSDLLGIKAGIEAGSAIESGFKVEDFVYIPLADLAAVNSFIRLGYEFIQPTFTKEGALHFSIYEMENVDDIRNFLRDLEELYVVDNMYQPPEITEV